MNDRTVARSSMWNLSRASRRWMVAVMYLCLTAFAAVIALGENLWWALLAIGLLVSFGVIHTRLIQPIVREAGSKTSELDERQLMVRDHAHYRAYQILGALFITSVLYEAVAVMFVGVSLPAPTTGRHFVALIVLLSILIGSLPASVVAWVEPDPPTEE